MSQGDDFRTAWVDAGPGLLDALGAESMELRRPHSLESVDGDYPETLHLAAAALSGATSVSLRLGSASVTYLQGRLVAGIKLTIGGQQYEVAAGVDAQANLLSSVTLKTALAAGAAEGDAVALSKQAVYAFSGTRDDVSIDDRSKLDVGSDVVRISVPRTGLGTVPRLHDWIYSVELDQEWPVAEIASDWFGGWDLICGSPQ